MNEQTRFLLVGAYNTAFGYVAFVVLYQYLHEFLHYLVIATISHAIAVSNSFFMQRRLVFRDSGPIGPAFLRFNLATASSLILGLAGMALLVDGAGVPPLISQAVVTMVSVVVMYLAHRNYTFRRTDK
ncbi:GtrA family protein [Sulfuritalea sp.]|uniref:GtrA family protein n=1 Tax=Sulfuritalea sp. TaxID=2480090 RepID=UPI00286D743B|nr:GtrA family protein [Sulfuritalea sp.]